VIANGYALNTLTPDLQARRAVREALSIAPEVFVFGMVARYDPQKDHVNLLQALSQVKLAGHAFVCLLAGVGMDDGNAPLLKQIEAAGIAQQVRLLGQRNDIPALMNALDVHVLSSLGEAFPNVLAEAMACGTPCVSTDVGDAALIMGDHGWVVPAQYPAALAGALMHAKTCFENDHPSWQVRQQSCREHIMANFELGLMCERYRQVWRLCAKDMKN
jgi:glycosyltransferase involved in cell wall biosynthesis